MVPTPTAGMTVGRPVLQRGGLLSLPRPGVYGGPGPYVYDATSARHIPAVGRALGLYAGLCKQMPMEAYRTDMTASNLTPRILARPDPTNGGPWFVQVSVEDYLLNGNAFVVGHEPRRRRVAVVGHVATRELCDRFLRPDVGRRDVQLPRGTVTDRGRHPRKTRRGPLLPGPGNRRRGGILSDVGPRGDGRRSGKRRATGTAAAFRRSPSLRHNRHSNQDVADEAKANWMDKFGGPVREPVILPNGTVVQPLAWSPTDTQLVEARHMSLIDVANMFNLDGYWLGAPVAGMTYRTAGPQYQQILRTSLESVLKPILRTCGRTCLVGPWTENTFPTFPTTSRRFGDVHDGGRVRQGCGNH